MTKTHFQAIASILSAEASGHARDGDTHAYMAVRDVAIRLAAEFNMFNPHFRKDIFLNACGF